MSWNILFNIIIFCCFSFFDFLCKRSCFTCTVSCSRQILFFEMWFGTCVSKCWWSKFVLLRRSYQIFLWRCAFFVSCLSRELAVYLASSTSCWVGAFLFLIIFFILFLFKIFEWFYAVQDFIWFPLCPNKVIAFPHIKVSHRPPKSTLEGRPYYTWVVTTANIVLIWLESCCRELYLLDSIWLKNLYKELSVILFL